MEKPNCYKCEYRDSLPGDAHSCCKHPAVKGATEDPFMGMMAMFASVGRTAPVNVESDGLKVRGSEHGIKNGWFNHPFNFDPVWLEECSGFTKINKT